MKIKLLIFFIVSMHLYYANAQDSLIFQTMINDRIQNFYVTPMFINSNYYGKIKYVKEDFYPVVSKESGVTKNKEKITCYYYYNKKGFYNFYTCSIKNKIEEKKIYKYKSGQLKSKTIIFTNTRKYSYDIERHCPFELYAEKHKKYTIKYIAKMDNGKKRIYCYCNNQLQRIDSIYMSTKGIDSRDLNNYKIKDTIFDGKFIRITYSKPFLPMTCVYDTTKKRIIQILYYNSTKICVAKDDFFL